MTLKELLVGFGTQVRSIWMIGLHAFAKRETRMYPEEPVYLPPRYRGRIVLTRDPDGEERCVACNLCAVACPVGCISLQKAFMQSRDNQVDKTEAAGDGLHDAIQRYVQFVDNQRNLFIGQIQ
ncbi:NADH-quinone oxidoreductase subunit I, partial [Salmonella enterica subsp. enterica serovar Kentucky]|nr:NADH-quinone oxidoreductase subunit I [Salmonella enterica subsp. enterica serovar Kentucky]